MPKIETDDDFSLAMTLIPAIIAVAIEAFLHRPRGFPPPVMSPRKRPSSVTRASAKPSSSRA